ncbi:helix-turn-helix transcriptional regulator [Microbacterium sp. YY-01]|uniref:helix-turn-helix transcriptional regulator n=1 Tax=Microbacterium sp. YY-01 TaxID=3421634 RepID=UPI003D1844B2
MATVKPTYGPISSYSRVHILHLVQTQSPRTIAELCAATGLHANTVREHVQRLIDGGYIIQETERRTTRGRPRILYSAATGKPEASSPIAREKAAAAARRGEMLRRALPETAGSLNAEESRQLDALIEHYEESGFEPVINEEQLTVELTPCPHAAALPEHRPMLCQVHLGLMQGVLAQARGPLFARCVRTPSSPEECTVELERTAL